MTQTKASLRGARLSAQKGRLVADLIRGKPVDQAINILSFSPKKGAAILRKLLESAIANAEHNDGADIDVLKVKQIYVERGMFLKRFQARAIFFFFQAEDGIRDIGVTGVQTCALPIWPTCVFTVASDSTSSAAISALD